MNNKEALDGVKSRELTAKLDKVTRRTLRDTTERVLKDRIKVKGAVKKIYMTMLRKPNTMIEQWKKYLNGLKNKHYLDNLRSTKLMNCLAKIPIKRMRD